MSKFIWNKALAPLMLVLALCSTMVMGADAAAGDAVSAFWQNPAVWVAILAVGGAAIGAAFYFIKQVQWLKNLIENNQAARDAVEAIHAGVVDTYESYVKARKDASADGVLTEEEKKYARELAINKAMAVAKGPGLVFLKEAGAPLLNSLVQQVVNKLKKDPGVVVNAATETPAATPAQ